MLNKGRFIARRPLLSAVAGGLALAAANSGVALAAYGPTPPVITDPGPGGFYCVVTSQSVSDQAGVIGPLRLGRGRASLHFGRRTFAGRSQVTLTEPFGRNGLECQGGRGIGDGGFSGFWAVAGLGILVQHDGAAFHGRFARPLRVRLDSPMISPASLLVTWNGRRFVRVPGAVVRRGSVRAEVSAGADLAILSPGGRHHGAAGSTVSVHAPGLLAAAGLAAAGAPEPGLGLLEAPSSRST
ncbi:MAG: hypothetical protein ACRDRJ_49800 [Streptosporangiaceae bacterium]